MMTILIVRLVAFVFVCWMFLRINSKNRSLSQSKELWKTLALATEVQLECVQDYYTRYDNEGCMTRSRRRQKDIEQSDNAEALADDTRETLMKLGEY